MTIYKVWLIKVTLGNLTNMIAKDLAAILLQNPTNEVEVYVKGNWHIQTPILDIKTSFNGKVTGIVVNNPESK
jgi:hypothetical protein